MQYKSSDFNKSLNLAVSFIDGVMSRDALILNNMQQLHHTQVPVVMVVIDNIIYYVA